MSGWPKVEIESLIAEGAITILKDGNHGSNYPRSDEFVDTGFPFLTAKLLSDGRIDIEGAPRLSEEKAASFRFGFVKTGDVLLSHNATVGRVAIMPSYDGMAVIGTSLTQYRVNPEKLLPDYLAYCFGGVEFQNSLSFVMSQSTRNQVPITQQRKLWIRYPSLEIQQEIVSAIKPIQSKIEVNRKASATLEAMARALYRSWFVDFDPVWAKLENRPPAHMPPQTAALFPDSFDDEGLPLGWRACGLDEIADFLNGAALQKHPAKEGEECLPVIKIAELRNGITPNSNKAAVDLPEKYRVFDGDVIFSWSGSLLQKVWTGGPGALNQHLFKVTSNTVPKWFHFFAVDQHMDDFRMTAASKATTMGHIQRHHLADAKIAMPGKAILDAANAQIAPLFDKAFRCDMENQTLATLRDSLLPRLMSGELRVGDARAQVEEVV